MHLSFLFLVCVLCGGVFGKTIINKPNLDGLLLNDLNPSDESSREELQTSSHMARCGQNGQSGGSGMIPTGGLGGAINGLAGAGLQTAGGMISNLIRLVTFFMNPMNFLSLGIHLLHRFLGGSIGIGI